MSSELAKIGIVSFFNRTGLETKVCDWKRTAKIKTPHGYLRKFENAVENLTVFVHGERLEEYSGDEDDFLYCHEAGELYASVRYEPYGMGDEERAYSIMFTSKTYWEREKCFPDQSWGYILQYGCNIPEDIVGDEEMENTFIPAMKYQNTLEELIAVLNAIPGVTCKPEEFFE